MNHRFTDLLVGLGAAFAVTLLVAIPALVLSAPCLRLLTLSSFIALILVFMRRGTRHRQNI